MNEDPWRQKTPEEVMADAKLFLEIEKARELDLFDFDKKWAEQIKQMHAIDVTADRIEEHPKVAAHKRAVNIKASYQAGAVPTG